MSRLTQARGLKQEQLKMLIFLMRSRLTQARGLKLCHLLYISIELVSRLTQARGLKHFTSIAGWDTAKVAPHAGAWIETRYRSDDCNATISRASRRRVD